MVSVFVNNQKVSVQPNTSVLKACEAQQIEIPRFCYHKKLSIAGNCRMCLVEIEKSPKPVVSCAMPVMEGMKIFTDTPLVKKARENVLEFLLLNHPLDCPICDQGGECDLQEQAFSFGSDQSRFYDLKRGVHDKKLGPLIKTIMTRCIHCTRCVRFATEVAGVEELGTTIRGTETEIGTYIEKLFGSELSGNVIDLCPVGALTSKPYAFKARPWELKTEIFMDTSDGLGSPIKIDIKGNEIIRITPHYENSLEGKTLSDPSVSIEYSDYPFIDEWISDKTRFSYDAFQYSESSFSDRFNNFTSEKISNSISTLTSNIIRGSSFSFTSCHSDSPRNSYLNSTYLSNFSSSLLIKDSLRDSFVMEVAKEAPNKNFNLFFDFEIGLKDNKNLLINELLEFESIDPLFFFGDLVDYDALLCFNYMNAVLKSKLRSFSFNHSKKINFNFLTYFNTERNFLELESSLFKFKGVNFEESFVNDYSNHNEELQNYWGSIERQQTNTSLCDLEKADLCLLIGVNPRYENSLYNVHLRKRLLLGGFTVASIGVPNDLTYSVEHLGLGTETLKELVSERHPFFTQLKNAKNPIIILGDHLKKNPDFPLVESLSLSLASKVGSSSNFDRLGFNVLNSSLSIFSKVISDLPNLNSLQNRELSGLIFSMGLSIPEFISLKVKNKVLSSDIVIAGFSNLEASKLSYFLDKTGTINYPLAIMNHGEKSQSRFLNTLGQIKETQRVINPNSLKTSDINFLLNILKSTLVEIQKGFAIQTSPLNFDFFVEAENFNHTLLKDFSLWKKKDFSDKFFKKNLKKTNFLVPSNINVKNISYKKSSSVFNSSLEDFYLSDSFVKSSNRMKRCSALQRKRITNFQ